MNDHINAVSILHPYLQQATLLYIKAVRQRQPCRSTGHNMVHPGHYTAADDDKRNHHLLRCLLAPEPLPLKQKYH